MLEKIILLIPPENITQFLNAAMSAAKEKIGSLQPGELLDILIKPGSASNYPALETLLRKYEDISKIGTVLDGLNQQVNRNNESLQAVLNGVWPRFVTALSSLNSSSLDQWFNKRLQTYLPFITQSQLNTSEILTTNCLGFRHLVKALNIHYHDYTVEMQQGIYNILKNYLLQPGDKPKCYNESDGNQNSTAWFLNYLGKYLTYCTGVDLRAFSDSQQLLQDFAVDPQNLVLVGGLALAEEVKEYYSDLIARQNPPLALGRQQERSFGTSRLGRVTTSLSCLSQVAGALPDITGNLSVETFKRLGPFAVRLTPSMLLANADGQTLRQVLPLLSATGGWSPVQASVIMNKVIQNGYQINKASSVLIMGKLALGLPVNVLDKLDNEDILLLAADENFTDSLEQAPLPVKYKFVQRILQSTTGSPFLSIPDKLADQIPLSRLASPQMKINEINQKKWAADQASVFFQAVLKSTQQYSSLSSTVLQGFSCGAANFLNNSQFASLAKAMKGKRIRLEDRQLSCMTKRLKGRITPSDLEEYPAEVLFYVGPETLANTVNCQKYFHLVAQANMEFLPSGSSKRESLLESAMACLGTPTLFSKENLQILGNLSCTLNGYYIAKSDPYILTILQSCMSFTEDQLVAIEQQLENKYGSPSTWTASTLTDMGIIASALRSGTLQRISETEKTQFFPDFLSQLKTRNRNQFTYILEQLANPQRQKRAAADCTRTPLTTEVVMKQRDLLASKYTSSRDLDACLPDDVLQNNLETFGEMEFQDPLLQVLKLKLDKIFGTLPEDYLPLLGNIARMYNTTEIAQWNITTAETLSALLTGTSWHEELLKVTSLVTRYLEANGDQLDAMMLTVLAPHICALEDTQLKAISREAIRGTSRPMNTTLCSQHKKNLLYRQLKAAYEEDQSSPDAYYQLLKPALGGAPTKDLIKFASSYPVMDIDTFTALNPTEVKQLSTQHLKDLLGDNLPELNNLADHPVVKAWTQAHSQSEVNSLGLHLTAGLPDQPPNGFINIPSVPHIPGRATTNVKDQTLQLFYCILFNLVLAAVL
ncbi:mesothelin-like [Emydura macquarii macquarii]|uniref:mesothelin-like n=1 Tax=Emydura macquarii macquarii TaxID=1129001 RepID=UPI00352A53E1